MIVVAGKNCVRCRFRIDVAVERCAHCGQRQPIWRDPPIHCMISGAPTNLEIPHYGGLWMKYVEQSIDSGSLDIDLRFTRQGMSEPPSDPSGYATVQRLAQEVVRCIHCKTAGKMDAHYGARYFLVCPACGGAFTPSELDAI